MEELDAIMTAHIVAAARGTQQESVVETMIEKEPDNDDEEENEEKEQEVIKDSSLEEQQPQPQRQETTQTGCTDTTATTGINTTRTVAAKTTIGREVAFALCQLENLEQSSHADIMAALETLCEYTIIINTKQQATTTRDGSSHNNNTVDGSQDGGRPPRPRGAASSLTSMRDRIYHRVWIGELLARGGIPRLVDFMRRITSGTPIGAGEEEEDTRIVDYMIMTTEILASVTYPGTNDALLNSTGIVVNTFVDCGGVELLVSLVDRNFSHGRYQLDRRDLTTLGNIWALFGHILHSGNKMTTTTTMVDDDDDAAADSSSSRTMRRMETLYYPILDLSIATMNVVNQIYNYDVLVAFVQDNVLLAVGYIVENAEHSLRDVPQFHNKNLFHHCVQALKNPVDGSWRYDATIWGNFSWLLHECCKQERTLLREEDFAMVIPFLIQFMKVDPITACKYWALHVIRTACEAIDKKTSVDWAAQGQPNTKNNDGDGGVIVGC